MRSASNLRAVRRAASRTTESRAALDAAIRQARAEGATLREIGDAAGLTPQRIDQILKQNPKDAR